MFRLLDGRPSETSTTARSHRNVGKSCVSLSGPKQVVNGQLQQYLLLLRDGANRLPWVYFLAFESEATDQFHNFRLMRVIVKILRLMLSV